MASLHDYPLITYTLLVDVPDIWVIANLQIMLGVAMQLIGAALSKLARSRNTPNDFSLWKAELR